MARRLSHRRLAPLERLGYETLQALNDVELGE